LGSTDRGKYVRTGEHGAPDLILDMLEGEGLRLARPKSVQVVLPEASDANDPPEAPLKLDTAISQAVTALAAVVAEVNAEGDFPIVLGGDQLAMCGHILGHAARHPQGIGLAVLADAHLDLATPGTPVYTEGDKLRSDSGATFDGDSDRMVLAAALRMIPESFAFGRVMAKSSVLPKQTSVCGVRGQESAQVRANERKAGVEVWRMERLELDGESAYRSVLARHLEAGPIVLSIDASGLDPHLMTAVRRQVSDGVDWSFLKRSLEQCVPHVDRLLGLDLSQIDPTLDDVHHSAMQRLVETLAPYLRRLSR
jgi:arginase